MKYTKEGENIADQFINHYRWVLDAASLRDLLIAFHYFVNRPTVSAQVMRKAMKK